MPSNSIAIVSEDFSREKGGIQMWSSLISDGIEELNLADVERISYENNRFFFNKLLRNTSVLIMNVRVLKYIFPVFFLISYFKKITVIVHGDDFLYKSYLEKIFLWFVLKLPRVNIYSNSEYTKNRLLKSWNIKSKVCLPFITSRRGHCKINVNKGGEIKFLTIGRLASRKNHKKIIEALHLLDDEIDDYVYIIIGDGPEYIELTKLVENLEMSSKVKFKGRVSEERKSCLLAEADYLLLPSIELKEEASVEGFGMVFIEANSHGIPVLGGESGGMPEAIIRGVTGEICDGSVDGIMHGIKSLLNNNYAKDELIRYAEGFDYKRKKEFYLELL